MPVGEEPNQIIPSASIVPGSGISTAHGTRIPGYILYRCPVPLSRHVGGGGERRRRRRSNGDGVGSVSSMDACVSRWTGLFVCQSHARLNCIAALSCPCNPKAQTPLAMLHVPRPCRRPTLRTRPSEPHLHQHRLAAPGNISTLTQSRGRSSPWAVSGSSPYKPSRSHTLEIYPTNR